MDTTTTNGEEKNLGSSLFEKISLIIQLILLALLPFFVIPTNFVSLAYAKMALVTVSVIVSLILLIVKVIRDGRIQLPSLLTIIGILAVPVAVLVSSLVTQPMQVGLIGNGFEYDTLHFLGLGFLLVLIVSQLFRNKQQIFVAYLTFFVSFTVFTAFHLLRFVFGIFDSKALLFSSFLPQISSNTIGAWNDLGTYAGLGVILAFITLELVKLNKVFKVIISLVLVLGLILLGITNYYTIYDLNGISVPTTLLVGLVALFVFVYVVSSNYRKLKHAGVDVDTDTSPRSTKAYTFPIPSLIVLIASVIFTIGAQPIAENFYRVIGISPYEVLDIRPTIASTWSVALNSIQSSFTHALFGIGPNKFYSAWAMFKPISVNQTIFWNTDFNYGAGYIPTFLTTTGILGFLAWIYFLGFTLWFGLKGVFTGVKDKFSQYLIVSSLLASGYLWFLAFVSITGPVIIILAFFFTGLLFASLWREGFLSSMNFNWITNHRKGFIAVLVSSCLIIASIAWGFEWSQKFLASVDATKSLYVANSTKDISSAQALMLRAIKEDFSDTYLRAYSQLKLVELRTAFEASGKTELTEANTQIFRDSLSSAVAAQNQNPGNYQNWTLLGSLYENGGLLGVENAPGFAKQSYEMAAKLNPTNPFPLVLLARLYVYAKDIPQAKLYLQQAITLKPDYTDALSLLSQIDQSKQPVVNTPVIETTATSSAVKSTSTASSTKR